jgi:poly-gamma-glutamate capsule biosynthesis protein CapA/YwtB (metallophosphatase superfamily)
VAVPQGTQLNRDSASGIDALLRHISPHEIPAADEVLDPRQAECAAAARSTQPLSLIAVGDIMLGGRTRKVIDLEGQNYPFDGVRPVLRRVPIVLGNLEGPFERKAKKESRNFSYRVDPRLAFSLGEAGINVVTLANNHLTDCGRGGIVETLDALQSANILAVGGGETIAAAHAPVALDAHGLSIAILGYYWNRRTAATESLPGSAMDTAEDLERDIRGLREYVDRLVVTFHWGDPYVATPSDENRAKARFAIDCGADAIVGHHPHVLQPFEVYRDRPIFYSVGNFAFGSANSRAEGLLVGFGFEETHTRVEVHPLYVKNRDPRVNYQPKLLAGAAASHVLSRLAMMSGDSAVHMRRRDSYGELLIARRAHPPARRGSAHG